MTYKLILKDSQVYAVKEEDLPKREDFVSSPSGWESYDMKAYQAALSEAIEKKGIRCVNVTGIHPNVDRLFLQLDGGAGWTPPMKQEGSLYEVPPNYQIVIEDKYPLTIKGPEGVYRKGTPRKVARIVPVAKQEPRIGEDNICPETKQPCDDECCSPGSTCNLIPSQGISAPDPLRNPKLEAIRERTPQGVKDKVDAMMSDKGQEELWREYNQTVVDHGYVIAEKKFTIQRRK